MNTIRIGQQPLSLEEFQTLLYEKAHVEIAASRLEEIATNYHFLQAFSKNKIIYGINTGFGPMAQYQVSEDERIESQYNLIRSHCAGSGRPLPYLFSRAMMIDRLNTLTLAKSGVHPDLVLLLKDLINHQVAPVLYEHGGVGASGDLVQLAHLGLALIGEGMVHYRGEVKKAEEVFLQLGLQPLKIHIREGLAILNGTSAMTGAAVINILAADNLLRWSIFLSAFLQEIFESYNDHFSLPLNKAKLHRGQQYVAQAMHALLSSSQRVKHRAEDHYIPTGSNGNGYFHHKIQEYYSLRCVPQILGPVYDTIAHCRQVVTNEINSVSDNPVIDHHSGHVYHGGNFHGDYVSLEMDKLKTVIIKLSLLSERQLNYLLNDKLNNKLPPFINPAKVGLNFGLQGVQFTATSTVAENQSLASPVYVHSIPCNNDNQDVVSMGFNAAMICNKVIENTYEVMAIELLAVKHAIDYLKIGSTMAHPLKDIYLKIQELIPFTSTDIPRYEHIQSLKDYLKSTQPAVYQHPYTFVASL
ncbi:MAG: histidine ammonia-lyase [Chitinophagales bacterium]|nr:MAG: histidine ammonia-lyase [Chitinophagales bacterium]